MSHIIFMFPNSSGGGGGGGSDGAMVLGKLPVPGRPTNLDYSRASLIRLNEKLNNNEIIYHIQN